MKSPVIKMIVAYANDRIIGYKNQIPWKLSGDLKRFKKLTTNGIVVMGRKTFESLPNGPLPDRVNIVLTRDEKYKIDHPNVVIVHSVVNVLHYLHESENKCTTYIIGGEEIYNLFLSYCDEILATEVHLDVQGDSYFPFLSDRIWKRSTFIRKQENGIFYDYVTYKRF